MRRLTVNLVSSKIVEFPPSPSAASDIRVRIGNGVFEVDIHDTRGGVETTGWPLTQISSYTIVEHPHPGI